MFKLKSLRNGLFVLGCIVCTGLSAHAETASIDEGEDLRPVVAGYGVEAFAVGELLYETDFSDLENWDIQLQAKPDSPLQARVSNENGMLDIYAPRRGCTAWLRQELHGPIAVVYRVRCPVETQNDEGIMPRDANNFWHASDPGLELSVLDRDHYTGDFGDYSEMNGYYASSGGRKNTSTRMRRYPRDKDGEPYAHIALIHQDKKPEYLLKAGVWHTVQLVAFNDIIQYYFDGQLVYEMREGDRVRIEHRPNERQGINDPEVFPPYTHGYFGFRMVQSHHQYKDFKVYRLNGLETQ